MSNIKIKLIKKLGDKISKDAIEKLEFFIANNLQQHQIDNCIEILSDTVIDVKECLVK